MKGNKVPFFALAFGLSILFGLAGCASGGPGGASGGDSSMRKDIGSVMVAPLTTAREKVFGKYSIPMYREEDTSRSIFWETQWIPREPAPEERAAGVTAARNRIIIRGTYVDERLDGSVVLRVRWEVENQVRTQMDQEWHPGPMPSEAVDQYEEVYDDIMLEVRAGIIR